MSFPIRLVDNFAGQNWLITPAALAANETPPTDVHQQKWLLTLSGVGLVGLEGNSNSEWLRETLLLRPTVIDPMHYAITQWGIPEPAGAEGDQYELAFQVEQLAPFASVSSMYDAGESIDMGFAVDVWRPNHYGSGIDVFTHQPVSMLFTGLLVDVAVRDTDAYLYRAGYDIALLGRIVFVAGQGILFKSDFDQSTIGQLPNPSQPVGTAVAEVTAGAGTVTVEGVPSSVINWVRIEGKSEQDITALDCVLSETPGPGVYLFSAEMYLPETSSLASLSFETAGPAYDEFMHIDFLPNNRVRVDDVDPEFGSFPRGEVFIVQVTLNLQTSGSTAKIVLSGGASGEQDATVKPPFQEWSLQFGAVRLWQGAGDFGDLYATNILVTRAMD